MVVRHVSGMDKVASGSPSLTGDKVGKVSALFSKVSQEAVVTHYTP